MIFFVLFSKKIQESLAGNEKSSTFAPGKMPE
jgi:hypothetical protein